MTNVATSPTFWFPTPSVVCIPPVGQSHWLLCGKAEAIKQPTHSAASPCLIAWWSLWYFYQPPCGGWLPRGEVCVCAHMCVCVCACMCVFTCHAWVHLWQESCLLAAGNPVLLCTCISKYVTWRKASTPKYNVDFDASSSLWIMIMNHISRNLELCLFFLLINIFHHTLCCCSFSVWNWSMSL